MKQACLFVLCYLPLSVFSQLTVDGKWIMQYGVCTNTLFTRPSSINVRCVSPRFRWSEADLNEWEQKHPEKLKRSRFMFELIYRPAFKVFCLGTSYQYRFLKYKKLSLEGYWGLKLFFKPGPDFVKIRYLKGGKEIRYFNEGLLVQFHLGMIAPFADIGTDGILTIGSEFNLHAIYKKPKRRYKLKPVSQDS
ncbi:MAG TPA: hypothetical protein VGF30_10980 [Bacteroidia bacterium]